MTDPGPGELVQFGATSFVHGYGGDWNRLVGRELRPESKFMKGIEDRGWTAERWAGNWPADAWWAVTDNASDDSLVVFRVGDHWVESPGMRRKGKTSYFFASWTQSRYLLFRGDSFGGNRQSFVIPDTLDIVSAAHGRGGPVSCCPPRIIPTVVRVTSLGAVVAGGMLPWCQMGGQATPVAQFWNATMSSTWMDRLPLDPAAPAQPAGQCDYGGDVYAGCLPGDHPLLLGTEADSPIAWRHDGTRWNRTKIVLPGALGGQSTLACTDDGRVWAVVDGKVIVSKDLVSWTMLELPAGVDSVESLLTTPTYAVWAVGQADSKPVWLRETR